MGLYGFKKQFVPFVIGGTRTHSIRAERKDGRVDKPGDICHLYYGLRTKQCQFLLRAPCVKVERISIYRAQIWLNEEELTLSEKDLLAWRDGFRRPDRCICMGDGLLGMVCEAHVGPLSRGCFDLMLRYWAETHGPDHFNGHMTHWDYGRAVFERGGKQG